MLENRKEFEAWALRFGLAGSVYYFQRNCGDEHYYWENIENAWAAWQASRAADSRAQSEMIYEMFIKS